MKLRHNKSLALMGVALGALMIGQSSAQADSTQAEIRMLKERLKQLEAKVADQAKKEKALAAKATPGHPPMVCKDGPCEPAPMPPPVWVSFENGLKVQSYEKDFSVHIGGRVQVDGGVSTVPLTGQSGNTILRRARLEVDGKAFKYWLYKMQYDFASGVDNAQGIRDAYLALKYPGLAILPFTKEPLALQVGNSKEPFSLEELTSSKYITFIERALPTAIFSPSRHIGFAVGTHGDNWSAKVGIYATSPEDPALRPSPATPRPFTGAAPTGGLQYMDIAGRVTWAPILEKEALLHFGGSARYQSVNSATAATERNALALGTGSRSEADALRINMLGTPDLSCGVIPGTAGGTGQAGECTTNFVSFNAELAASYGPFNFQGEYFGNFYNRSAGALAYAGGRGAGVNATGGTSLYFDGFYVYGSWFLTGESRAESYKVGALNSAEFGRIKVLNPLSKGGWGAWELAARFSQVNLNNNGIQGGLQQDVTVGVNWYPEKGYRLMANWISVVGNGSPYDRPYLSGQRPNIFLVRAQADW